MKERIIELYESELVLHGKHAEAGHLAACVAHRAYNLTDRQWNGKAGSDAFASTLTTLVMAKRIKIDFSDELRERNQLA